MTEDVDEIIFLGGWIYQMYIDLFWYDMHALMKKKDVLMTAYMM